MPHTGTVYLALLHINPVLKMGRSDSFTPSPIPFMPLHASEPSTALALPGGVFAPSQTYHMCRTMSLPHLCCLHVDVWFTERQQHVMLRRRPLYSASSGEGTINMCTMFFSYVHRSYTHSQETLKAGEKEPFFVSFSRLKATNI